MLKGLLHRADHSGSAHLDIEVNPYGHSSEQVSAYLIKKHGIDQNSIWQLPLANSIHEQNVVLQAGTGSGKTEFALYWIGQQKAFYTLPMRTSVNAMYERIKETYTSEDVGLLHSDSALHVLSSLGSIYEREEDNGIRETLRRVDISRQLSMPISVSTADQIFTAAFRYKGYEKIFATLSYSRIIIDEIQSYDPDMVAVILKTLIDLSRKGCKFCVITATLPNIYLDYLRKNIPGLVILPPRFKTTPRHRIKVLSKPIDDPWTIDLIINLNKKYCRVLVIVNTVKMAKRLKKLLTEDKKTPASLFHSMFTYEDRDFKENGILHCQKGIWITTQITEVSLNIDFNVMVTEISSIDSQVQRWGRVWRNRGEWYTYSEPNVYVALPASDNGHIYDKDIVRLTESELCKCDSTSLSDSAEYSLVQTVFSDQSLEGSKYISKFWMSLRMLGEYNFCVDTKGEAQRLFRHISNITIIPSEVYFMNQKQIDDAISIFANWKVDRFTRLKSLLLIRKKSVAVPHYYLNEIRIWPLSTDYGVTIADMKYSSETGVELAPVSSASFI